MHFLGGHNALRLEIYACLPLACIIIIIIIIIIVVVVTLAQQPNAGQGRLFLEVSRSHTVTHHTRYDSSGRGIGSSQRPLPDLTQHSQQTNIHALDRIRTRNPSKRAAADPRVIPHLWHIYIYIYMYMFYVDNGATETSYCKRCSDSNEV